jgi:anti-sigma factor RsiW
MSVCERLSDRMPAVARGHTWTAEEQVHLAGCADCAAEWALMQSAQALGAALAADIDPQEMGRRVLSQVRADWKSRREYRRTLTVSAFAAAAALALVVWSRPTPPSHSGFEVAQAQLTLPELDALGAPELEVLLQSMDRVSDDASVDIVSPPGDLDGGELEAVLEELEG